VTRIAGQPSSQHAWRAVKPPAFAYHAPGTVDEAVATLGELGADGKVLAGGQSLVPLLNMRLARRRPSSTSSGSTSSTRSR
jgi:hypothetical protein